MKTSDNFTIARLNERSRDVFRQIAESYMETGDPVGSRTLSRRMGLNLSPATIRNVMADLEEAGLLFAPHTSAGRLPTEAGMRLFVDGLLEIGELGAEERANIDTQCQASGKSVGQLLMEASSALSGLSHCAGLVVAPKTEGALKQIEFVNLGPGRVLVVMVTEDGRVENRVIDVPLGIPPSALIEAANYLNSRLVGRSLAQARTEMLGDIEKQRARLDQLTQKVVEAGLAVPAGGIEDGSLFLSGQANLLEDVLALEDLERIRNLFESLERKEGLFRLLDAANQAEGVQIFIGAENALFSHAGLSLVIAPFSNARERIVGAIGVIGPTRINYARIIPMVDYTAQVIGRLISYGSK